MNKLSKLLAYTLIIATALSASIAYAIYLLCDHEGNLGEVGDVTACTN